MWDLWGKRDRRSAAGGLVGNNAPGVPISGSYNTGSVSGAAGTGGLVGSNTTGTVSGSYSTGSITGLPAPAD